MGQKYIGQLENNPTCYVVNKIILTFSEIHYFYRIENLNYWDEEIQYTWGIINRLSKLK